MGVLVSVQSYSSTLMSSLSTLPPLYYFFNWVTLMLCVEGRIGLFVINRQEVSELLIKVVKGELLCSIPVLYFQSVTTVALQIRIYLISSL